MKRLGLRSRLGIALAAVAIAAVALATVLANAGLGGQLDQSAAGRLDEAATHLAEIASDLYDREGGWTAAARRELVHLGAIDGLRVEVRPTALPGELSTVVPVQMGGREIGRLAVRAEDPVAFREPDRDLHHRLNRLHLAAGILAAVLALVAAFVVSAPLARPLRRLTDGARRMEQGALDARVQPAGGPELEQLAHALNRLASTLEREESLRREAAADLAHELRTPLSGILGRIEAAQDGVLPDERANLAAMHAEALRLRQLVEDIGRLADAQQLGEIEAIEPLDLAAVAAERAQAFAARAKEAGITLDTELAAAPVAGDRRRLEQVIDNLIANALRYTDRGGRVAVRTRVSEQQSVLEVADTGIGIAPEELPYVFERFWRSDKSRARRSGGTGIGLAIVQELVRAHHGHVEVTSRPGEGSTFFVRLPLDLSLSPARGR